MIDLDRLEGVQEGDKTVRDVSSLLFSKERAVLVVLVVRRAFSARCGTALGSRLHCEVCCQHNLLQIIKY